MKHHLLGFCSRIKTQPPSGGCVLKQSQINDLLLCFFQPPSGGCVLKHYTKSNLKFCLVQPPSGGCVLKHTSFRIIFAVIPTATFGRLCVETTSLVVVCRSLQQPPSGGCVLKRLRWTAWLWLHCQPPSGGCVLKQEALKEPKWRAAQPPSGGCVLKPIVKSSWLYIRPSRLRAAVC